MPHRKRAPRITGKEYAAFEEAYDWFNTQLFNNTLPPCLITLQRKAHSRGYFAHERFGHRLEDNAHTDELALNPDTFIGRADPEILSTLVHEMVHCWQQHYGHPSRTGYHNREWAQKMIEVGLMPSDTGEAGGKQTGQRVTHLIISCGPFDQAARTLLTSGFQLHWQSVDWSSTKRGTQSKTKFQCPSCAQRAWAKPDAELVCGTCMVAMEAMG